VGVTLIVVNLRKVSGLCEIRLKMQQFVPYEHQLINCVMCKYAVWKNGEVLCNDAFVARSYWLDFKRLK
jgi:hypothetical protein